MSPVQGKSPPVPVCRLKNPMVISIRLFVGFILQPGVYKVHVHLPIILEIGSGGI